jgi:hypothetical protein
MDAEIGMKRIVRSNNEKKLQKKLNVEKNGKV